MSEEIIKVLEYIGEKLGIAIDWTQANALPYAQELFEKYISYEVWTSVFWILFWILVTAALAWFTRFAKKKADADRYSSWGVGYAFALTCLGFASGITLVVIAFNAIDIITCATFPEKILLELLKSVAG